MHLPRRNRGARDHRQADRRTRGQSLVEFALVLPIMLVFLASVLDLGRVFYANITLHNAAKEGAFEAARDPGSYDPGAPCDLVTNRVVCIVQLESQDSMVSIDKNDITMTCGTTGCPAQAGSMVTVNVKGEFRLLTPLLAGVFGSQDIALSSTATAQIQHLPDPNVATPPPAPVADFGGNDTTPAVGQTVTFTDTSTGDPTGWQWDFGDGNTSTDQNPTHAYATDGVYTVTLSVVNLTGADFETKTDYITVGSAVPSPSPAPSPTPACAYPPNIIGEIPTDAEILLGNAGFTPLGYGDLTTGQKNKVQAQNPDHTQCLAAGTTVTFHYRPQN